LKRGLARSGATIVFEPILFMLLLMPVSLARAEAVDEHPGEKSAIQSSCQTVHEETLSLTSVEPKRSSCWRPSQAFWAQR
jgi:hypothetical protein